MKELYPVDLDPPRTENRRPADRPVEEDAVDNALIQAIATGSQLALNKLYCRHRLLLRKIIAQTLPDDADIDETLQDVFLGIWNNAASFNPTKGYFIGWMICIARRRAIDQVRRTRHYKAHTIRLETMCGGRWCGNDPLGENVTAHREPPASHDLRDHLLRIIAVLPPEQRQVVQLTYYDSLSQREIVALTGIPLGTIKTRLELARRKLLLNSEHLRGEI